MLNDFWTVDFFGWGLAALIIFGCSLLQSVAGFGFSLLSVPMLLFAGYTLPQSVVVSLMTSAAQRLFAVRHLRHHVPWRYLWPVFLAALLLVPAGIAVQWVLDRQAPVGRIRQGVGVLILLVLLVRWLWNIPPRSHVAPGWGLLAGGTSGFLAGLANIGGPPLILWSHAHRWDVYRLRVVTLAVSLPLVPFQVALQWMAYGRTILPALGLAVSLAPVAVAGGMLGIAIGRHLSLRWLKVLVHVLLLAIALAAILKPLL